MDDAAGPFDALPRVGKIVIDYQRDDNQLVGVVRPRPALDGEKSLALLALILVRSCGAAGLDPVELVARISGRRIS